MRGYLVSIESAEENEFIKDAVMCNSSTVELGYFFMLLLEKPEKITMAQD